MPLAFYAEMAESAALALALSKSKKTARPFVNKVMNVGLLTTFASPFPTFPTFYKG